MRLCARERENEFVSGREGGGRGEGRECTTGGRATSLPSDAVNYTKPAQMFKHIAHVALNHMVHPTN